jgi:uncharacterized protein (DUF1501 family)
LRKLFSAIGSVFHITAVAFPKHGDLRRSLDFRQIYATVLEDWLGLPAKEALSGAFERLPLLRG